MCLPVAPDDICVVDRVRLALRLFVGVADKPGALRIAVRFDRAAAVDVVLVPDRRIAVRHEEDEVRRRRGIAVDDAQRLDECVVPVRGRACRVRGVPRVGVLEEGVVGGVGHLPVVELDRRLGAEVDDRELRPRSAQRFDERPGALSDVRYGSRTFHRARGIENEDRVEPAPDLQVWIGHGRRHDVAERDNLRKPDRRQHQGDREHGDGAEAARRDFHRRRTWPSD